jgi:HAD superfamily hydrolase (TIGR01484 family)
MKYKWIILDIDGCISPEESVPWDMARFGELARRCREASEGRGPLPPFSFCTGRPQPYVEVLMKQMDVRAPVICENGAVIYSLHDNRSRFGPGVTTEKIEGLREVRLFIEHEILPKHPEMLYQFGKEAQMSIFSEQPEGFPPIQARIEEFVRAQRLPELVILPSHFYLNISVTGVDKGSTLTHLLEELGAVKEEAVGIGDTEGDLPLRDAVGFFGCPANATPPLHAVADYVSPYSTVEGVLDILAHIENASERI